MMWAGNALRRVSKARRSVPVSTRVACGTQPVTVSTLSAEC
jgi:hypothetical protein